jgi:hypothetical protein
MINAPSQGWTLASIEVNTTAGKETLSGWSKGSFGIVEFDVETKQAGWLPVASLTHLGTGWRVAAFANAKDAAIAGDLAEQCADWATLCDPALSRSPSWRDARDRMVALWEEAGIVQCFTTDDGKPVWAQVPESSGARHESRA